MQFFAIQLLEGDTSDALAEAFLRKVQDLGYRCKTLQALDTMELGSAKFMRFSTDLVDVHEVVATFLETSRGIIVTQISGYQAQLGGGKKGPVAFSKMQVPSRVPPKVYRGNALVHWERQFLK